MFINHRNRKWVLENNGYAVFLKLSTNLKQGTGKIENLLAPSSSRIKMVTKNRHPVYEILYVIDLFFLNIFAG